MKTKINHKYISMIPIILFFFLSLACNLSILPNLKTATPVPTDVFEEEVVEPEDTETPIPTVELKSPTPVKETPVGTPKATVQPTKPQPASGVNFQHAEGLPETSITDLYITPQQQLTIAGKSGLYMFFGNRWESIYQGSVDKILGMDGGKRLWILLDGGSRIAAYVENKWRLYEADQGWRPLEDADYLSPGIVDGLATDQEGRVWLATGRNNIRRFTPSSGMWTGFRAEDIGFTPPADEGYQGHFLTDVIVSDSGKVWVSDCIGEGEGLSGQGIQRYDGESWQGTDFMKDQCVFDMEIDKSGRVWAAGFDALFQYDPSSGSWTSIALPKYDRRQIIANIQLDPLGQPWVEVYRFGGASPLGATARYHLENEQWVLDLAPDVPSTSSIAFQKETAYICSEGKVYKVSHQQPEQIGKLDTLDCKIVVDSSGLVWIAAMEGPDAGLWWFKP